MAAAPGRRKHQGGEGPQGPSPAYQKLGEMLEGEFFRELRRIKGWDTSAGLLRRWDLAPAPCECPVTAVTNRLLGSHFDSLEWKLAAWAIGLPEAFARNVVLAADNEPGDPKLRARLLEACGIKA